MAKPAPVAATPSQAEEVVKKPYVRKPVTVGSRRVQSTSSSTSAQSPMSKPEL
ncbi:hypothetical protein AALB_2108 [Agarivorans albus MKT 106]|uniref:Uncharacterized protein n=3 Tax=Agarivorans albus TaxID=182262 RepID=R9PL85_AGAAL|nr:hypothetical protein AALB_2108 [Agarivorans albus MKT 106]